MEKSITYFEEPGIENTDALIELVKERLDGSDIKYVAIASATGASALKLNDALKELDVTIVNCSHHVGFKGANQADIDDETTAKLEAEGVVTFIVNGRNHTAAIVNGNATWADALRIGENYVTAIFEGNVNYTTSRNTTTFLGNKTNSTVNVTATTVVYGNASEITVLVPKAQTGFVRIVVNGTDINVTVEIVNGVAKFNATGLVNQ